MSFFHLAILFLLIFGLTVVRTNLRVIAKNQVTLAQLLVRIAKAVEK